MRAAGRFASLAAILTLIVVAASAAIRLGADELGDAMVVARGVHRAAASIAALLVLALAWRAFRFSELRQVAFVALVLMFALSAVGWATGTRPPPAAALFNQLGGVALAALLAWLAGHATSPAERAVPEPRLALVALLLVTLQVGFGAAMGLLDLPQVLVVRVGHAVLGLAAAALAVALGARLCHFGDARRGTLLVLCAALAPLAGSLAVLPAPAIVVQVLHATAAALLVTAVAHAHGRLTRSA